MIVIYKFILCLVSLSLITISCATKTLSGNEWIVLSGEHAKRITSQCSRPGPEHFDSTWELTRSDIEILEEELEKLQNILSKECCDPEARISNVHKYHRQYIGIIVDGKRLIYINAFRPSFLTDEWRSEPILI